MFLLYEQEAATAVVKTAANLAVPVAATHVELQASANHVSYTMDATTNPTQTAGMFLLTTERPQMFLAEDVRRIRFVRGAAGDGALNCHYYSGNPNV